MKKTNTKNGKRWQLIIGMLFLLTVTLSSCVKDKNPTITQSSVNLAVLAVSPDAPSLNLSINGTQVNAAGLTYATGLNYFITTAGKSNVVFYATGTSTKLAADTINFTANRTYTLFLANSITKPDFILLADTITAPASGMASMRFINASANSTAVALTFKGTTTLIGPNTSYKSYTSFESVKPATDTLEVLKAGTTNVLASLPTIALQSGGVYTVWYYGIPGATDATKPSIGIMTNALFY